LSVALPEGYIPAVIDGVEEPSRAGVLAGYPVVDVEGSHYLTAPSMKWTPANSRSKWQAFSLEGRSEKAAAILLEPIMKDGSHDSDEYQGDLSATLNRRRGRISALKQRTARRF